MRSDARADLHPYPAKFPGWAIRPLIERYSKPGELVLDPFCGSGTTLVESRRLSRNAVGIELNPVGVLVSRTRSQHYSKADFEEFRTVVSRLEAEKGHLIEWISHNRADDKIPQYHNREHWFSSQVQVELAAIRHGIIDGQLSNQRVAGLLTTALSRIIVPVSYQDGETRYARVEKSVPPGATVGRYLRTLRDYIGFLENERWVYATGSTAQVIEGDALQSLHRLSDGSVDFAVTSPPYLNSFDYYLYHKQRIYWLGGNPQEVRAREIGLHHRVDTQTFEVATEEYRHYMLGIFSEIARLLKPRRRFVVLIGDARVKGRFIDMKAESAHLGTASGFELEHSDSVPLSDVSRRFLKTERLAGKQHHVLVFRTPGRQRH